MERKAKLRKMMRWFNNNRGTISLILLSSAIDVIFLCIALFYKLINKARKWDMSKKIALKRQWMFAFFALIII